MKIHSNVITAADIARAASYASLRGVYGAVFVDTCERQGSRTRTHAWKVHLRGDGTVSRRRPNSGKRGGRFYCEEYAATWCQWGDFLASLYAVDPDMHCAPYYGNADDYHRRTGGAFLGSATGSCGMAACSACRGTIGIPYQVRWAAVPQPTRNIPEGATARPTPARPRIYRQRPPAPTQHAEPTQRDIVAEIERTVDAYERTRPGAQAEFHTPYGSQLGDTAEDPCGYRFC